MVVEGRCRRLKTGRTVRFKPLLPQGICLSACHLTVVRLDVLVGLFFMLKLLLGDPNARKLKRYQPLVSDINLLEEEIEPLSDDQLRGLTTEFRQKLANAETPVRQKALLDELLPQAFAVVREARQAGAGHAPFRCSAHGRHRSAPGGRLPR